MRIGLSRASILEEIKKHVLSKGVIGNLYNTKDTIKLLNSPNTDSCLLYSIFLEKISKKIYDCGGILKELYFKDKEDLIKITFENCNKYFYKMLFNPESVVLRILIKNKYFEASMM